MSKIRRLEATFTGEDGGAIVEAIRACNRRLDSHRDTMDDFYARISTQDWYHDVSDQEGGEETENQPGIENRSSGRRRLRGHAPQRRTMRQWTRTMPRPPPPSIYDAPPTQDIDRSPTVPPEMMQQAMQRLFVACSQCVNRVAQTDDRMEQFRTNLRRDALELALNAQRTEQDVQHQHQAVAHIKETLSELSTNVLLEVSDLKSKVCRLTEQSTKLEGDVSFLSKLSAQVELLENQIVKWRYRLPELTDDESQEKIVSAVEVREELDEFKDAVYRKLKEILTSLNTLRESVRLIENDQEESRKFCWITDRTIDGVGAHRAITENHSSHRG